MVGSAPRSKVLDAEVHFDNRLNNIAVNDDYPDDIGLKLGRASKYHGALKGLWKGLLPSQVVYGLAEMSKDAQLLSKDAQSLSKDAQSLSKDAQSLSKDAQSLSEDAQSLSEDAQSLS